MLSVALQPVGYEVIGRAGILIGLVGLYGSRIAPRRFVRKRVPLQKLIFLRILKYS